MKQDVRTTLRDRRETEMRQQMENMVNSLQSEGYDVTFGNIGQKTTYALLTKGDDEIVGYTFIKDLHYKNQLVGDYKALQQAMTRKSILETRSEELKEVE